MKVFMISDYFVEGMPFPERAAVLKKPNLSEGEKQEYFLIFPENGQLTVAKEAGDLDKAIRSYDDCEEKEIHDSLWAIVHLFYEEGNKKQPLISQWGLQEALMAQNLWAAIMAGPPMAKVVAVKTKGGEHENK